MKKYVYITKEQVEIRNDYQKGSAEEEEARNNLETVSEDEIWNIEEMEQQLKRGEKKVFKDDKLNEKYKDLLR